LVLCLAGSPAPQDTPTLTVDEHCTAFAYAPDGRIAYAVRHILTTRRLEIQRDDIWLVGRDGKRRRIVNGERLVQGPTRYGGPAAFSYTIHSLRWSPGGTRMTVELLTSEMIDQRGNTREGQLTLLLDENGKEIRVGSGDSVIAESTQAAWLADGATVVYLKEAVEPKLLYAIHSVRPAAGRGGVLFADHVFAAAAWNPRQNAGVGIERERSLRGAPRLVALDLLKETRRELATLEGYAGGLSISPSGAKVAYFRDPEVLEVREVAVPERAARIHVAMGAYQWAADENRILLKRGPERRSADLAWVSIPPVVAANANAARSGAAAEVALRPVLHGLSFRAFEVSPDGRSLAVIEPGKRNLLVYPVE